MKLQEFEDQISRLSRLEIGAPVLDGYGQRCFPCNAIEAADRLLALSQELRRIVWASPFRGWARELADRADAEAERIATAEGYLFPGRRPRFESFTSGGMRVPEIV